jgi:phosphoglycerate dehydrogenase-like enzyme
MKIAYLAHGRPDLLARIPPGSDYVVVSAGSDGRYSEKDLEKVADVDAFIVSMEPVGEQILAACSRLRVVQRLGAGYETLDLEAAARRGIPCCNLPGVNKEAVAEHCMTLILALTKHLREAERLTRQCDWPAARALTRQASELQGKTLGIVGLGNTGSELARRARAFRLKILYNDIRDIDPGLLRELGATFMEKETLFGAADIMSINTDLNPSTRNMVDARLLGHMKPTAMLILCARGGIVDERALRDALNEGRIAAAGVDVYAQEPITEDNPLLHAKNTLLTGHVAGMTEDTSQRIFDYALENVRAVVEKGARPRWILNGV